MTIYALSGFISGTISFILGILVYFRNRKKEINQIFGLLTISIILWGVGYGMWQISPDKATALFWIKILSVGVIFIPIFFYHWVLVLLNLKTEKRKSLYFGYFISLLFFASLPTSLFVKTMEPELIFLWWPKAGVLFYPYVILNYIGIMGYGFYLLLKTYSNTDGYKREQIKYTIIGTFLGIGGGATNIPLWFGVHLMPLGTFFVPLYPFILGYAISRYRLMDVRFVLGRGMIYVFSIISILILAFLLLFISNQIFPVVSSATINASILIISILFFQPVFIFFEKIASKYFYYTFYSYQSILSNLGKRLTEYLNLDELAFIIVNTLIETIKLDRMVVLVRKEGNGDYKIQKNIGFREENGISLVKDNFLTTYLEKSRKPLVCEELALIIKDTSIKKEKENLENLKTNMERIEAALCLPLLIKGKIIGMIVLGNKISGDPYFEQDIKLLINLSSQASIAFQNAKLYSEIQKFNKKLEDEVEKATKELKEAYEELQKLDKAKSEFVSIASHQLRTPLTAIKGYISMMLEKVYGNPPQKMKDPLKNIYASNERLIKLVNDLLNVSRIEAGRIEIKKESFSLEEVTISIIKELKNLAENKNIYLKLAKHKKTLSNVFADKDKIRQAIANIIDNAIHYTDKGGITVEIKENKNNLQIAVKDTGEGMTKTEIISLFESFSRGKAGTKLWTEGTGLGLYVTKKLITLNEGKVWAESEGKNKGSTFYIELPIK